MREPDQIDMMNENELRSELRSTVNILLSNNSQLSLLRAENEELKRALEVQCPWPESVWTMTTEQYVKAVPDKKLRTAISGFLMRQGWELCLQEINRAQAREEKAHDVPDPLDVAEEG